MNFFAVDDLLAGAKLYRYWLYRAFIKLQVEHRRTRLSVLWAPITIFFVAGVLSLVWSKLLGVTDFKQYFLYILIGVAIWSLLIVKLINRAVMSLAKRGNELMLQVKPISTIFFEELAYSFQNFLTAIPFILVVIFFTIGLSMKGVMIFLGGLVLIWFASLALCMTLGLLAFFMRDVVPLVQAIMRLGFLTTPIIWRPERLGEYQYLVWFNPFYSYLDICRGALLGEHISHKSVIIATCLTLFLFAVGMLVFTLTQKNIRRRVFVG